MSMIYGLCAIVAAVIVARNILREEWDEDMETAEIFACLLIAAVCGAAWPLLLAAWIIRRRQKS